jgi:Second Messenger Oligonucleotide or Dinucleotide Synthetase domain
MPYTVPVSFDKFIETISLTGDHNDTASARKDRVVSLLSNTFTILDAFPTGSIPNGTALKAQSDLDVMVVLHWTEHIKGKRPQTLLQEVRDALGEYRTGVRKNGQAVTLHYESWPNVDIVPVSRVVNNDDSVNYYSVPDMNSGGWLKSRPRKHASTLTARVNDCGFRFKPLIRMIKQWNKAHSDLMQAFHIEVLCISIFTSTVTDYPWAIFQFFEKAIPLVKAKLPYENGYADDYLTKDDRDDVLTRLETAKDQARTAWYQTFNGRGEHEQAIQIWRQIFGDKFPAYG